MCCNCNTTFRVAVKLLLGKLLCIYSFYFYSCRLYIFGYITDCVVPSIVPCYYTSSFSSYFMILHTIWYLFFFSDLESQLNLSAIIVSTISQLPPVKTTKVNLSLQHLLDVYCCFLEQIFETHLITKSRTQQLYCCKQFEHRSGPN